MRNSFVFLVLFIVCLCHADNGKKILILDSYHDGFDWSDTLLSVFKTELRNTELYIEHFDSKRFFLPETSLFENMSRKYYSIGFDLIIACDNYSLDFMLNYDSLIFVDVPVVFTGINNFSNKLIENRRHQLTGVTEAYDIEANLRLMSRLQQGVKNVLVISDNTLSGLANKALIENTAAKFDNLRCHYLSNVSVEEIIEKVQKLGDDWVILHASFHKDRLNHFFTAKEITSLISSNTNVPVYSMNDNIIGHGVLGGCMVRARTQAIMAAQIAGKILSGENPGNIPVITNSPNECMFDYIQLKRFKISSRLLPAGSVIINKPPPFYKIDKSLLWSVLVPITIMCFFSFFMLICFLRRKKVENALNESEGTIRQIAENIREAFWLRADDKVFYVSPAFDEIFGWSKDEFISNPDKIVDHVYEEDKELIRVKVDSGSNCLDIDREIRINLSSGAIRWIRYRSFPIKNSLGKIYRMAEVAEDITIKKITEDEILKAQKLESLGLLAGGIAHDFNNLLSGMMGYLDLAKIALSSGNTTKVYGNLEDSLKVCTKARDLTNRLLTFSKGGVPVKKVQSIKDSILNAVEMANCNNNYNIACQLPHDLPFCNIDEGLIRQALYNIILNACQAVTSGGIVTVKVEQISELRNGHKINFLSIAIIDNGPGIKKENLSKVFDPFFTTKIKGNGLGLSAAYSIINNHDGLIKINSEEGKGTTFNVLIPVIANKQERCESGNVVNFSNGKKVKILWLDDEPFIIKMAENILSTIGYKIVSTTSSKIAMDFFDDSLQCGTPFDIIVLDLNLKGGIGGKDVLEMMLKKCPGINAIACSGYFDDPVMSDPVKYGFKLALKKPYTSDELQKALKSVLSN